MKTIEIKNISPNTFCVNPWYHLRINSAGRIGYCIRSTDVWDTDTSHDYHNLFNNSGLLKAARQSMLNGEFPAGCNRCIPEEKTINGAWRKSQNLLAAVVDNEFFHESIKQSPVFPRLGSDNIRPHFVFVMFGNQCNLTCRMCSTTASNKLAAVYDQHGYKDIYGLPGINDLPSNLDWTQDDALWQRFLSYIVDNRDLEQLAINGGEPFVTPRFYEIIDHLIKHNRTDLRLGITTNGTVYDHATMLKLQKFRSCFIDVSIEAIDPVNDYVRVGSNYQQVHSNFLKFLECRTPNGLAIGSHPTPMAYTIEKLHTFLDLCVEYDLESWITPVHPQRFLKVEVLPPEIKQHVSEFLKDRYHNVSNKSISNGIVKLRGWLDQPESEDIEDLRKTFVEHTKNYDRMLGTDFAKTFPHLVEYYKAYGF